MLTNYQSIRRFHKLRSVVICFVVANRCVYTDRLIFKFVTMSWKMRGHYGYTIIDVASYKNLLNLCIEYNNRNILFMSQTIYISFVCALKSFYIQTKWQKFNYIQIILMKRKLLTLNLYLNENYWRLICMRKIEKFVWE